MKKALSLFLALIMILSIGTIGVCATSYSITLAPTLDHVRKDNMVYYPVQYDLHEYSDAYAKLCTSEGIDAVSTHIELGYTYDAETLKFIDVLPSETLYNCGGTLKVKEQGTDEYGDSYFIVEIDFSDTEALSEEYFFNLQFEVLQENFFYSGTAIARTLVSQYPVYADLENLDIRGCVWNVTDSNGEVHDLSESIYTSYIVMDEFLEPDYNQLLITDYEPFVPPIGEEPLFNTGVTPNHVRKDNAVYYPIGFNAGEGVTYAAFRSELLAEKTVEGVCYTKAVMKFIYDADTVEFIDIIPSIGLHFFLGEATVLEHGSTGETGPDGQDYNYLIVELNVGNISISDEYSFFYLKFYVKEENFVTADGKVRTVCANADYEEAPKGKGCIWQFVDDKGIVCDISDRVYLYNEDDYPESCTFNDLLIDDTTTGDVWEKGLNIDMTISKGHGRVDNHAYYPCKFTPGKAYAKVVRNLTGFEDGTTRVKMKISYDSRTLEFVDALPSKELYDIGGTVTVVESGVINSYYTYLEYVIIQVDFDGFTGLDYQYLYSLKFNVLQDNFVDSYGKPISLVKTERFNIGGVYSECHWSVTGTDGRSYNLTEITAHKNDVSFDSAETYEALLIEGYEPFDPTECFELIGDASVKTQGGVNYIVGLRAMVTKANFNSAYINYKNVTVEYTMSTARYLGTGSKVTVKSSATGEVIAEYIVVVYGDIDGTGTINARDVLAVSNSISGATDTLMGAEKIAANLEGSRDALNAKDVAALRAVLAGSKTIDRTTGKAV